MIRSLTPIAALLISDALVLLGHGLLLTLLPVSANLLGFSDFQVGLTASSYFVGFVAGCLATPFVLMRVGHIRTFAVLASAYTVIILLFVWSQSFIGWMILRFMIGAMVAGIYMIIESWLNERADSKNRGAILSFYAMLNLTMITLAQQLLNLGGVNTLLLFTLAGIFLSLSIIPVSLTLTHAPTPIGKVSLDFAKVWRLSHVGIIGAIFAGLITGSFWALAPLASAFMSLFGHQFLFIFMGASFIIFAIILVARRKSHTTDDDRRQRRLPYDCGYDNTRGV